MIEGGGKQEARTQINLPEWNQRQIWVPWEYREAGEKVPQARTLWKGENQGARGR